MNAARVFHTATRLADGTVLVAGGYGDGSQRSSCEVYDPASGTWESTGAMSAARAGHTATLLSNGRTVVVTGGFGSGQYLSGAEACDSANRTWTAAATMTTARTGHTASLLPDGTILVAGGYENGHFLASAEGLDPDRGLWTSTGEMNSARDWHTATVLPDGRVLAVGGWRAQGDAVATAEWYNTSTPILLSEASLLPEGVFQFAFTNTPGLRFSALATTNLSLPLTQWTSLGGVTEVSPGQFRFADPEATNTAGRFYGVSLP